MKPGSVCGIVLAWATFPPSINVMRLAKPVDPLIIEAKDAPMPRVTYAEHRRIVNKLYAEAELWLRDRYKDDPIVIASLDNITYIRTTPMPANASLGYTATEKTREEQMEDALRIALSHVSEGYGHSTFVARIIQEALARV